MQEPLNSLLVKKAVLIFQHNHFGLLKLNLWLEACPCIKILFWSLTLPLFRLLNLNTKRKIGREHSCFLLEMGHSLIPERMRFKAYSNLPAKRGILVSCSVQCYLKHIWLLAIVPLNKHCKVPAVGQYCLKPYRPDFQVYKSSWTPKVVWTNRDFII